MLSDDDRGTSLIELLAAMIIGLLVIGGAGWLLIGAWRGQADASTRVDATGRARVAVDRIVRDLSAQACVGGAPAIAEGTATSVRFTADPTGNGTTGEVTYAYSPTTRRVTRTSGGASRIILTDAIVGSDGALFKYYAYDPQVSPTQALVPVTPTAAATAARRSVVRVAITLGASGALAPSTDRRRTLVSDDAWVGTADGESPELGSGC